MKDSLKGKKVLSRNNIRAKEENIGKCAMVKIFVLLHSPDPFKRVYCWITGIHKRRYSVVLDDDETRSEFLVMPEYLEIE